MMGTVESGARPYVGALHTGLQLVSSGAATLAGGGWLADRAVADTSQLDFLQEMDVMPFRLTRICSIRPFIVNNPVEIPWEPEWNLGQRGSRLEGYLIYEDGDGNAYRARISAIEARALRGCRMESWGAISSEVAFEGKNWRAGLDINETLSWLSTWKCERVPRGSRPSSASA